MKLSGVHIKIVKLDNTNKNEFTTKLILHKFVDKKSYEKWDKKLIKPKNGNDGKYRHHLFFVFIWKTVLYFHSVFIHFLALLFLDTIPQYLKGINILTYLTCSENMVSCIFILITQWFASTCKHSQKLNKDGQTLGGNLL